MATVRIQEEPFDAGALIAQTHRANPKVGAVAAFIGLVRDVNEGSDVAGMTLEHYPGMTERAIERICRDAAERWEVLDARVVHRVGTLRADRSHRRGGGGERAPQGRVRGVRVHHGLPQDPRAVLEEGAHRGRRTLGGSPRERRRGGGAVEVTGPTAPRPQYMCCPPLIESVEPVMKPMSSSTRNSTPLAISLACPSRPTGMVAMIFSSTFSGTARTMSVSM